MKTATISTKEAAELLQVSDQTVINWWKDGLLEGYKKNPSKDNNSPLRIHTQSVEKILRERAKTQTSRAGV